MSPLGAGGERSGGAGLHISASGRRDLAVVAQSVRESTQGRLGLEEAAGIPLLLARLPSSHRVAFTTRLGGVSESPYASLNLSPKTGDRPAAVGQNLTRLRLALEKIDGERKKERHVAGGDAQPAHPPRISLVSPHQVHGTRVVGAAEHRHEQVEADGLVVHPQLDRGTAALLLFADCVPVVLVGEVDTAVVHAGWRGLLEGVIQQGARAMTGPPALAIVGPSVGPCCYAVGEDLRERFARRYGPETVRGENVDLWNAARAALIEVGVPSANVINPHLCTNCDPHLFFSHRREGPKTGRQGALAWWAGA